MTQKDVIAFLCEAVADQRLGMLLVTHDRVLAERAADRTVEIGPTSFALEDPTSLREAAHA